MEECTGKRLMGTQGKQRENGNEEGKVTMSTGNVEAVGRGIQSESEYFPYMRKM